MVRKLSLLRERMLCVLLLPIEKLMFDYRKLARVYVERNWQLF
jgi:hypothetical protein